MSDLTEAQMDEYRNSAAFKEESLDDKSRLKPACMTDRAIAEESLVLLRAFGDALQELGNNPMLKAMMPKGFGR